MSGHAKEFVFLMLTTTAAILLIEPLMEKALLSLAPTWAAKVGVTA
jgi:hypothetical protein